MQLCSTSAAWYVCVSSTSDRSAAQHRRSPAALARSSRSASVLPGCLRAAVLREPEAPHCPDATCGAGLAPSDVAELLTAAERAEAEARMLDAVAGSNPGLFVRCPKCATLVERVPGEDPGQGADAAQRDRAEYRLRCAACSADFCASCHVAPFHDGETCAQCRTHAMAAAHCRYCGADLAVAGSLVCAGEECQGKSRVACTAVLACGHVCYGTCMAAHSACPPCLHESCGHGEAGEAYCPVCWTEGVNQAPAIVLACGHLLHYECARKKVEAGWPGSRITFGFLDCPVCKRVMEHEALAPVMKPFVELRKQVESKALARLKSLGLWNSPEVSGNRLAYAMHRFSYFPCFKCKKPYYGGERVCEGGGVEEFKKEELLCSNCVPFAAQAVCPKHGTDFIEWKCRFCCNVSVWFCWGTTHFCNECHKNPAETMRKQQMGLLPKCTCSIKHPPNGQEFLLGCSLCRLETTTCFR
eukprot:m51a1_g1099 putative e3 ubiquitin-protein ligase (471) ;mRNA; f:97129-107985